MQKNLLLKTFKAALSYAVFDKSVLLYDKSTDTKCHVLRRVTHIFSSLHYVSNIVLPRYCHMHWRCHLPNTMFMCMLRVYLLTKILRLFLDVALLSKCGTCPIRAATLTLLRFGDAQQAGVSKGRHSFAHTVIGTFLYCDGARALLACVSSSCALL